MTDASLSKRTWVMSTHSTATISKMDSLSDEIESILYIAREVMGECRVGL